MNEPRIQLLDNLGDEFARLEREWAQTPRVRRWWRVPVLVLGVSLALGGSVVAAVITLDNSGDKTGLAGTPSRQAITQGTTTKAEQWLLTSARNGNIPCLSLRVTGGGDTQAAVNCGGMTPNTFAATSGGLSGADASRLLFGTTPAEAASVRVTSSAGVVKDTPVVDDSQGLPGKFFVVELPAQDEGKTTLRLLGNDSQPITKSVLLPELVSASSPLGP